MTARVPIAVIKGGLQGRVLQLVRELVPDGRERHGKWEARNPTRADKHTGSFHIWLRGPAAGCYKDYATGEKGDILDLVRYVKGGERADAIAWAKDWLGLSLVDASALERMRAEAQRRREASDRRAAEGDARKVSAAFRLFCDARPGLAGTPAERYLATRGIPLDAVPNLNTNDLRWHPALEWWKGARWEGTRKVEPGPRFPALVCAIRSAAGEVRAVHLTFLAPDGSGKAPVALPKLMFGLVLGGVIRLTHGPSGLSPEEAAAAGIAGTLGLGEGVEDGLTIGLAVPEARVWAATSLSNLRHVPVWHPCVSDVLVAQDNDWGQPQAFAAFEGAIDAMGEAGKPIGVARSHHGKDFNDLVRSG